MKRHFCSFAWPTPCHAYATHPLEGGPAIRTIPDVVGQACIETSGIHPRSPTHPRGISPRELDC
ncbi:hypothetical protein ACW9KT_19615 [Hymenobacter sp. HD11105]